MPKAARRALAKIGALNGLAEHRRDAQWKVEVVREQGDLFAELEQAVAMPLAPMDGRERSQADYATMGLTTGPHPMKLIRDRMDAELVWRAANLPQATTGMYLRIAGW